nr:aspartic peptidase A1 family [Ipomoea batatas]GMC92321.1 aspartic peptidase A1 family [Ipomoea batatas]GMD17536.1 aspartic peptidase A1 family [Ipomoea batatas]
MLVLALHIKCMNFLLPFFTSVNNGFPVITIVFQNSLKLIVHPHEYLFEVQALCQMDAIRLGTDAETCYHGSSFDAETCYHGSSFKINVYSFKSFFSNLLSLRIHLKL